MRLLVACYPRSRNETASAGDSSVRRASLTRSSWRYREEPWHWPPTPSQGAPAALKLCLKRNEYTLARLVLRKAEAHSPWLLKKRSVRRYPPVRESDEVRGRFSATTTRRHIPWPLVPDNGNGNLDTVRIS